MAVRVRLPLRVLINQLNSMEELDKKSDLEDLTAQECLESLIGFLSTPIGRRKNSQDINLLVQRIEAEMEDGKTLR